MSYQKPKISILIALKNVSLDGDPESWNYPIHGLFVTMKVRTEAVATVASAAGTQTGRGWGNQQVTSRASGGSLKL